jgi:hypothetical protein
MLDQRKVSLFVDDGVTLLGERMQRHTPIIAALQLPCNAKEVQSVRSLEKFLHFTVFRGILQAHKQDVTAVIIPTGNVSTVLHRGPRSPHKTILIWVFDLSRLDALGSLSSAAFRIDESAEKQECTAFIPTM